MSDEFEMVWSGGMMGLGRYEVLGERPNTCSQRLCSPNLAFLTLSGDSEVRGDGLISSMHFTIFLA